MKTKNVILFLFLLLPVGSIMGQNWSRISKEIKKAQESIAPRVTRDISYYYKLRKTSGYLKEFSPIAKK